MDHRTDRKWLIGAALWLAAGAAADAGERIYGAEPMESQWQASADALQCRLEHPIPQFGRASFVQAVESPLRFELQSLRPQQAGEVALRAIPPEWRPGFAIVELGEARLATGQAALNVGTPAAEWLLAELEEGVYPAIFYPESAPGRGGVAVVLSGVRFRDALDAFLDCRAKLLKVDVAALRSRTLRFKANQTALDAADREALAPLARFARSGTPQRKVIVEAHTDASGSPRYNARLARERAAAVRDFLVAQGVLREQIQISALGETKPVADNRSAAGRAANRRAEVRVVN